MTYNCVNSSTYPHQMSTFFLQISAPNYSLICLQSVRTAQNEQRTMGGKNPDLARRAWIDGERRCYDRIP